jgi:hypothetical protein
VGGCALAALTAQAKTFHKFELPQIMEVLGSSPCQPVVGLIREANAMTVFGGKLYVAESLGGRPVDGAGQRVDEFDPTTGECVAQLPQSAGLAETSRGVALGGPGGEAEMFVGARRESGPNKGKVAAVFGIGPCGDLECASLREEWTGADTPDGSFSIGLTDLAVDHSTRVGDWAGGDVFVTVSRTNTEVVDVFKPEAGGKESYVTQLTGTGPGEPFVGPERVAVSGFNGDVVVVDRSAVDVFEPTGLDEYAFVGRLSPPAGKFEEIASVSVDGGSDGQRNDGEIYVTTASAIYEFGPELQYRGETTGQETPERVFAFSAANPHSVAVDPVSHRLFAGVFHSGFDFGVIDKFGPDVTVPDTVTESVSNLRLETEAETGAHSWSLKLNGEVNPDEAGAASCQFVWGVSKAFGHAAPCTATVPDGAGFARVHANVDGLEPDTTYYYRLQATNANGTNAGEEVQDREFTTPGPGLHSESASSISSSSATLEATIAPHDAPDSGTEHEQDLQALAKAPTTVFFQYSTENTAGCAQHPASCASAPLPPENIGSGKADVEVSPHIQGLEPDTTYHYRVVAVNEALPETQPGAVTEFDGPDRTFITQGPGGQLVLPDGRAWELVSPPDKHGAVIAPISESGVAQASTGGGTFTFLTSLPTESEPQAHAGAVQVLATRGSGGWSSVDIAAPRSVPQGLFAGQGQEYRFFSADLTQGVEESLGPFSPLVSNGMSESFPEATERTPYLRHDSACQVEPAECYTPLVTGAPGHADVPPGTEFGGIPGNARGDAVFVGATPDAQHALLSSSVALTAQSAPAGGLYEWSADMPATERLKLVSLLPADEKGGAAAANPTLGRDGIARHAISDDGSRVFFSADGALYVRDMANGENETARLDLVEGQSQPTTSRALFQTASANGAKAFFTDNQALAKGAGVAGEDLYECEIIEEAGSKPKCDLSDLTPEPAGLPATENEPAEVQGGVLGASEDGSYVYFVANGALAPGATRGDCNDLGSPKGATCNLYVARDVAGVWTTTLVTTLSGDDMPDWTAVPNSLNNMTSRVSPDGQWLAFMSDRSLTGYDNRDVKSGEPDEEVYLYDAATATLVCASCDPTGARPRGVEYSRLNLGLAGGDSVWPTGRWLAANIPGWTPYKLAEALYQSRYLSDTGRLFFDSSDALVSQDTNSNEDVYEYEPVGVGSCRVSSPTFGERSGGCVGLISSGVASGESAFLDASESGSDVFFITGERLVPKDVDGDLDVYDAHECTSDSPCTDQSRTEPLECTSASQCRATPLPQPSIFGAPSSATFSGPGNLPSTPPPATSTAPTKKSVAALNAEKLAKALKACRKKPRRQRAACERAAHRRYGPAKSSRAKAGRSSRPAASRRARR